MAAAGEGCTWDPGSGSLTLKRSGLSAWPSDAIASAGPANVRMLDLRGNQITTVPGAELLSLSRLERLFLHHNSVTALPSEIGSLAELRELDVGENCLAALPPELCGLARLERLDARANALEGLPEAIGRLASLRELFLGENRLARLPDSLFDLTRLERLHVQLNHLEALQPAVGHLARLRELLVYDNRLRALPEELGGLALEQFECYENPLAGPLRAATDDAVIAHLRALAAGPPARDGHGGGCRCGAHPDA